MSKRDKPLVRPLSPYWQYVNVRTLHTMGFSILHRITGVALSIGAILLVYWLLALASGPAAYARAQLFFDSTLARIAIGGWIFSFCYHFINGIRHLIWDTGRGFELATARKSGYAVFVSALLVAALVSYLFLARALGGAP